MKKEVAELKTQLTAKCYPLIVETKGLQKGREKDKFTSQSTLPARDRKSTNHKPDTC